MENFSNIFSVPCVTTIAMRRNWRGKSHTSTHIHTADSYLDRCMDTAKRHKQMATTQKETHAYTGTHTNNCAGTALKDATRTNMETEMTYLSLTRALSHAHTAQFLPHLKTKSKRKHLRKKIKSRRLSLDLYTHIPTHTVPYTYAYTHTYRYKIQSH